MAVYYWDELGVMHYVAQDNFILTVDNVPNTSAVILAISHNLKEVKASHIPSGGSAITSDPYIIRVSDTANGYTPLVQVVPFKTSYTEGDRIYPSDLAVYTRNLVTGEILIFPLLNT